MSKNENFGKEHRFKEQGNIMNYILWALFIIYMLLLTWIILFKMQFSFAELPHIRNFNFLPFSQSVKINGSLDPDEIINNLLVFIPVGVYLAILFRKWRVTQKILLISGISIAFELLQYVMAIGATDITDVIMNTLGGGIGVFTYAILFHLFGKKEKFNLILTSLAFISTLAVISLLALLLF